MSDHIHAMKELCNSFSNGKVTGCTETVQPQSVEEAGVKREQNTGFFEIEVQKEGEGEGNKADGNPATCV